MYIDEKLNVLWVSKVQLTDGMYGIAHTHDYFHFSCSFIRNEQNTLHHMYCNAPGALNTGFRSKKELPLWHINVMFQVEDKRLYREIETFPFTEITMNDNCYTDLLIQLIDESGSSSPDSSLINSGFSYYIQLLMHSNQRLRGLTGSQSIIDRCNEFIENNYMRDISLNDIAAHVERSRTYVSSLFSQTYGRTLVEQLNLVRIQKACTLIAYSEIPLSEIPEMCGFFSSRNFNRVFKNFIGTTPKRYRTSHVVQHLQYDGDINELKRCIPEIDMFTYVVNAQKRIDWKTEYEYILQHPHKL